MNHRSNVNDYLEGLPEAVLTRLYQSVGIETRRYVGFIVVCAVLIIQT
jgi:hypothetical protein